MNHNRQECRRRGLWRRPIWGITGLLAVLAPPALAQSPNPLLPHNLSPWGMFLNADIIVKAVMIGLAFASLVTWTVALSKGLEVVMARRRLRKDLRVLAQARSLADAARQLDGRHAVAGLIEAALAEVEASVDAADKEGI